MACIYKATFKSNGKSYIGQTKREFKERQKDHKEAYKKRINCFYAAIRSHGWDDIEWTIIEECPIDKLNEREIYWINYYRTYIGFDDCKGYNMTLGGDSGPTPCLFINQEEVDNLLEAYKRCGNINQLCEKYDCAYTVIYKILTGQTRQEYTQFKYDDRTFIDKYRKKGLKYTNQQIQEVVDRNKKGETNPVIAKEMEVPIKWVQDVLSGRLMSKRTGIKHVTRKERGLYNPVNSKFTKSEILDMVDMFYNQKKTTREIADKYDKNISRIYEILRGKTWSQITFLNDDIYFEEVKRRTPEKEIREKKPSKTISDKDVLLIVSYVKAGIGKQQIAEKFNTTELYVGKILRGERRNNVTHIKDKK